MRLLVACALVAGTAVAAPEPLTTVILEHVPWVKQRPDFCGEACVEMAARRLGKTYDQDAVFAETGLDPALGRGAYTPDLVRAVHRLGFAPPSIYTLVDARSPQRGLATELAHLHADLARGVPSIVCMHYDDQPRTTEHFRLVVGFDAEADQIVYQEPAEDAGEYRRMDRALFEKLWQLPSADASKRVLVRIALVPGELSDPAPAKADITQAALVQHVMTLRERLQGSHLQLGVHVSAPFVIAGAARDAKARATKLMAGATDDGIVDVFVFDRASFAHGVEVLRGRAPDTSQGFYSAADHAVYVNLAD
jgi:Peptidase_C39 like family